MILDEFSTEFRRLVARFGEKNYSQEFSRLLWLKVNGFGVTSFRLAVDDLVGEYFRPVGISDIINKVSDVEYRLAQDRKRVRVNYNPPTPGTSASSKTPWPPSVEGLMQVMKRNFDTGSDRGYFIALKILSLKDDDALRLFDFYTRKDFFNPDAMQIVAKCKSRFSVEELARGAR